MLVGWISAFSCFVSSTGNYVCRSGFGHGSIAGNQLCRYRLRGLLGTSGVVGCRQADAVCLHSESERADVEEEGENSDGDSHLYVVSGTSSSRRSCP